MVVESLGYCFAWFLSMLGGCKHTFAIDYVPRISVICNTVATPMGPWAHGLIGPGPKLKM